MEKQGSKEWHDNRRGRVTGSIAGAILGISKFKTKAQVLREMVRAYHGYPSEFKDNIATRYGKAAEEHAVGMFEMETGLKTEECGFFKYEDWLGASPDRIVYENGTRGVLEIKCPFGKFGSTEFTEILPEYWAQIQIEMLCADAQFCYFMQWSPEGYSITRFEKDNDYLDGIIPRLLGFWMKDFFPDLINPAHLEPLRATVTDDEAIKLAEEYKNLGEIEKSAETRKKEILAQLVEMCGKKNTDIGSFKLTKVEREGTVDYKAIVAKELPEVDTAPYKKKGSSYWRLS